jgi:predicted nucleic acid-binding protein
MVCVDTSVLIAHHRNPRGAAAARLRALVDANEAAICGQVWVEFVGGYRNARRRSLIAGLLREFPCLDTSRDAFELAAEWVATHRAIGPGDAIIAATAVSNDVPLLTIDRGFEVLAGAGLVLLPLT